MTQCTCTYYVYYNVNDNEKVFNTRRLSPDICTLSKSSVKSIEFQKGFPPKNSEPFSVIAKSILC